MSPKIATRYYRQQSLTQLSTFDIWHGRKYVQLLVSFHFCRTRVRCCCSSSSLETSTTPSYQCRKKQSRVILIGYSFTTHNHPSLPLEHKPLSTPRSEPNPNHSNPRNGHLTTPTTSATNHTRTNLISSADISRPPCPAVAYVSGFRCTACTPSSPFSRTCNARSVSGAPTPP